MNTDDIALFWDRLTSITAGFLGTKSGTARPVPMSHTLRDGDSTIWFITARDTDLAEAVEYDSTTATYLVAEGDKGLYATIHGELMQNKDPALRDELWSTVADSWFQGGKDDPQVCVLGLQPERAEIWLTTTSGLSFAYNVLRAQVTGKQPDMGSHGEASAKDLATARVSP